jgi:hypothetical protein
LLFDALSELKPCLLCEWKLTTSNDEICEKGYSEPHTCCSPIASVQLMVVISMLLVLAVAAHL